jgi:Flavodoxin-like fold
VFMTPRAKALDEFLAADIVVLGAPMSNFTVPSQLKTWIDCILIAGKTFRYSKSGPQGLAGGKKVLVASSRGGLYVMAPNYQEIPRAGIPEATTPDGLGSVRVIAGEALGARAIIETRTPIGFLHSTLAPGASVAVPGAAGSRRACLTCLLEPSQSPAIL